jgi:hypothetical protein
MKNLIKQLQDEIQHGGTVLKESEIDFDDSEYAYFTGVGNGRGEFAAEILPQVEELSALLKMFVEVVAPHFATEGHRHCCGVDVALVWLKKVTGQILTYDEETILIRHLPNKFKSS